MPPDLAAILREQTERARRLDAAIAAASGSGDAGINELLGLSTVNSVAIEQAIVAYKLAPTDTNARALRRLLLATEQSATEVLARISGGAGAALVTAVTVAATPGAAGVITYNGTFTPGSLTPLPGITIDVLNGATVVATEPADTVGAGTFSGGFTGLAAGARTVRATADGGATATSGTLTVTTDTTPPQIVTRALPSPSTLVIGQTINIELIWSEPVIVTGAPFLPAVLDSGAVQVAFAGGSGTTTTLWQYAIQAGNTEAVGVELSGGITLNGGTIRDAAANNANLITNNGATTITGLLVDGSGSSFASPGGVSTWSLALDARNPAAFGGTLPSNGASVTTTSTLYSAAYALAQDGANAVPTFAVNGLGTGRHGLRWGATAARLLAAGMGEALWTGDMAGVLWIVLRAQSSLAATQFVAGFCHPTGTANSAHNNFSIIGTTASIIGRYTGVNTTGDVTIASTIPTGENVLLRLRRLNSTDTTPLSIFRDSTTDGGPASGGNANATTPAAASAMRFVLGQRLFNSAADIPLLNIDVGAIYYLAGEPAAGTITAVETDLKSAWGIV